VHLQLAAGRRKSPLVSSFGPPGPWQTPSKVTNWVSVRNSGGDRLPCGPRSLHRGSSTEPLASVRPRPISACASAEHRCAADAMIAAKKEGRMSTITTTDVFADVDRMDAKAFASYLDENCVLRFANADEVLGREAIEAAIAGFFTTIKGLSHRIVQQWELDDTTIVQNEATYTRMDDREVMVPAVTIYRRSGDLIDDYRIYVDLAPVYA
jgi:ketosteroid isomerase-like protein